METSIPLIGVLVAAVSAFVIGGIWYSPAVFLKPWLEMSGTTEDELKKRFAGGMLLMAVGALLTAYILAHFIVYTQDVKDISSMAAAVQTSFWAWLGFSATTVLAGGALEARNPKLMLLTAANRLLTFLVMGLIIGAFL